MTSENYWTIDISYPRKPAAFSDSSRALCRCSLPFFSLFHSPWGAKLPVCVWWDCHLHPEPPGSDKVHHLSWMMMVKIKDFIFAITALIQPDVMNRFCSCLFVRHFNLCSFTVCAYVTSKGLKWIRLKMMKFTVRECLRNVGMKIRTIWGLASSTD